LAADYDLKKLVTEFPNYFSPVTFQVKHPEVEQFLGGRLYDRVFKFSEA
jgi:hypothetical protein